MTMILETWPADDIPGLAVGLHPGLLHLVRMRENRRQAHLEDEVDSTHWRLRFHIQDGQVWVLDEQSRLEGFKHGLSKNKLVTTVQGGSIRLSGDSGHLHLVPIKPNVHKGANSIKNVLKDRVSKTGCNNNTHKLEEVVQCFKGKEFGTNLQRLKLKVSFFNSSGTLIASSTSPQTLIDIGSKEIGSLEMFDVGPLQSCSQGGRKVFMVSKFQLAEDVEPRFEVHDSEDENIPEATQLLVQPSIQNVTTKNSTIIFLTPPQPHLDKIEMYLIFNDYKIVLVAQRKRDKVRSQPFPFTYVHHTESCDHSIDGKGEAKIRESERPRPHHPIRQMRIHPAPRALATLSPEDIWRELGCVEQDGFGKSAKSAATKKHINGATQEYFRDDLWMFFPVVFILSLTIMETINHQAGQPFTSITLVAVSLIPLLVMALRHRGDGFF